MLSITMILVSNTGLTFHTVFPHWREDFVIDGALVAKKKVGQTVIA